MLWAVVLIPLIAGVATWLIDAVPQPGTRAGRVPRVSVVVAAAGTLATLAVSVWAAWTRPEAAYRFGAGITLHLAIDTVAAVGVALVAVIATAVMAYAAQHEEPVGSGRLLGELLAFVAAMQLLVSAADLLTLLVGWELVGALSWALIGFTWHEADKPAAAAHAFNATRFGDLGLFVAAGAALAGSSTFSYDGLTALGEPRLTVLVAGVLLAASAKSGQVLFAPWLFSAMGGPTSVSALLHASTMVAAGAYLLIRLHPVLDQAAWFGPATIAIGLTTALAGGVVASLQVHAKKLLAASTSAHYGLMFVAVGAGYPVVALAHLVVHAVFKAHLFLAAGVAMEAVASPQLGQMRLGSRLPATAGLSLVSALALAAVVPLGGAWSKEQVVAAAGHEATVLAVLVLVAGGLSAVYATRFQLLAFGRTAAASPRIITNRPGRAEITAMAVLAVTSLALSALWLPPVERLVGDLLPGGLPEGTTWELVASVAIAVAAIYLTWNADRAGRLASFGLLGMPRLLADWLAIPAMVERLIVRPSLAAATALARFDDGVVDAGVHGVARAATSAARAGATFDNRVVDAGIRGVAALASWSARILSNLGERGVEGAVGGLAAGVGTAGRDSRRLQTGMTHHYYVVIAAGLVVLVTVTALWR